MDDTKELFNKIKNKDKDSFHILTDTYGWKLYSYIRRNEENRENADKIFSDTLTRFHQSVGDYDCEDPIEAMLCLYADSICHKEGAPSSHIQEPVMQAEPEVPTSKPEPIAVEEAVIPEAPVIQPQPVPAQQPRKPGNEWQVLDDQGDLVPKSKLKGSSKQSPKEYSDKQSRGAGSHLSSFFYGLCILLLILGITAALWFLIGILVDMEILPASWDLGYSWFNDHIAFWF